MTTSPRPKLTRLFCSTAAALAAISAAAADTRTLTFLPDDPPRDAPGATAPTPPEHTDSKDLAWYKRPVKEDWIIQVEPKVWYASPSGKIRLPGTTSEGGRARVEQLKLDAPRLSPAGEAHLRAGDFRFAFSGAAYGVDRRIEAEESFRIGPIDAEPGDTLDVSFDYAVFETLAGYRLFTKDFAKCSRSEQPAIPLILSLDLLGGARMRDISTSVSRPSGEGSTGGGFFIEPVVGARAEIELTRYFTIDLQLSGGWFSDGSRDSASLDVAVGFIARPHHAVGAQIGWRQGAFWLSRGDGPGRFEHNGRVAGLFFGALVRY